MKYCNNCGKELNDEALFCSGCGASAPPAAASSSPPANGQPAASFTADNPVNQAGVPEVNTGSYYQSSPPDMNGQYPQSAPNPPGDSIYQGNSTYQAPPAGYQVPPAGYQAPPAGYQAPPAGYQAPPAGYQAPPAGYQAPPAGYQAPPAGYQAPPAGYQAPPAGYQAPPTGYQAPPSGQGPSSYQGGAYYSGGAPGQYYDSRMPQGSPYGGGPNYPRKNGNKTTLIIIISIIAVILIGGGIFAYLKFGPNKDANASNNKPSPGSSASATPSHSPSPSPSHSSSPSPSHSPSPSPSPSEDIASPSPSDAQTTDAPANGAAALDTFDSDAKANILAAFDEIKLDPNLIKDFSYYKTWVQGSAYSFTYKSTVIDLLMFDSGKVFTVETNGIQPYLAGYESLPLSDYLGGKKHFDEIQPQSGYMFYDNGTTADSMISVEVGDSKNYVVQIIGEDGYLVSAFYMDSNTPLTPYIPAGTYTVEFAAGDTWDSIDNLFGTKTQYFKLDDPVTISPDNQIDITLDITGNTGTPFSSYNPNA